MQIFFSLFRVLICRGSKCIFFHRNEVLLLITVTTLRQPVVFVFFWFAGNYIFTRGYLLVCVSDGAAAMAGSAVIGMFMKCSSFISTVISSLNPVLVCTHGVILEFIVHFQHLFHRRTLQAYSRVWLSSGECKKNVRIKARNYCAFVDIKNSWRGTWCGLSGKQVWRSGHCVQSWSHSWCFFCVPCVRFS